MEQYRVGVIGHSGKGDYGHGIDNVWLQIPQCEIVGVADAHEGGRNQAIKRLGAPRGFADYRRLLDETQPDIVAVCPRWLDQHCDMVLAAAERGMHIYSEKPMCRTLDEADQMAAACQKHNVKYAIAHQTRYSPKLRVVRNMIDDGMIGKVLEFRGRGKEDGRGGGEDLWVLGSHIMNLIHHLGGEPHWCFASVLQNGQPVARQHVVQGNEGIGALAGDSIEALYGLVDNATAYFGTVRNQGRGRRFGLQVYGSDGVIELLTGHLPSVHYLPDPMWSPGRSGKQWVPVSSAGPGQPEPLTDGGLAAGNVLAVHDLLAAIEEDRLPECNVYEARTTVEMIAAVFESHRTGGPVTFPLTNRQNPLTLLS